MYPPGDGVRSVPPISAAPDVDPEDPPLLPPPAAAAAATIAPPAAPARPSPLPPGRRGGCGTSIGISSSRVNSSGSPPSL